MQTSESLPPPSLKQADYEKLKKYLIGNISRQIDGINMTEKQRQEAIQQSLQDVYTQTKLQLPPTLKEQVFRDILDELLGFGVIQSLLDDRSISEIMINGPEHIYIEQKGKLTRTNIKFEDDKAVMRLIDRIISPLGRRIDADSPMVDARLPDGSRVNAIIPPVAIDGPSITIRKFDKGKLTIDQLIELGSITQNMAEFVRACVISRFNILVSGGTGSGKTTLLNILSGYIPESERILTIEDAAELKLQQEHVVRLETKPANVEGLSSVTIRDLVRNALRMRPDRIIVGEVRGGEALDMLQAMNTGHDGSLTTVHANSPRDAISRLETLCMMAGMELPIKVIREQIASALDLIVQQTRLKDGTRKVTSITEVSGMEGDTVVLTEIFRFEQTGVSTADQVIGTLKPTGIRPLFTPRLEASGFKLGPEVFGANLADILAGPRRHK
jgi:pilus assembly protein CpaF